MCAEDFQSIDNYYPIPSMFPTIPLYQRDYEIAALLRAITGCGTDTFTYVIKYGCHFSFDETYPPSARVFTPPPGSGDTARILSSYHNAIAWSVDGFWRRLVENLLGKDVVVIYTSDHGQSLEGVGGIRATHATSKNPPATQGTVPLLIWVANQGMSPLTGMISRGASQNRGKASHFELFPSLLCFFGYPEDQTATLYGPPLWHPLARKRRFLSGAFFNASSCSFNAFDP